MLNCEVPFASPGTNDGKQIKNVGAIQRVFRNWQTFNGLTALLQCLVFSAESGIDQSQHAQGAHVIRIFANSLLLLSPRSSKGRVCTCQIASRPRDQTFPTSSADIHLWASEVERTPVFGQHRQSALSSRKIAFTPGQPKPRFFKCPCSRGIVVSNL